MERQQAAADAAVIDPAEAAPHAPTPRTHTELILGLQRTAGNAAVTRALVGRAPSTEITVPSARAGEDHRSLRHLRHDGTAFVRGAGEDPTGVNPNDVVQGALGDCFFLSPLMAVARANPQMIRDKIRGPFGETAVGAQIYEVKLFVPPDSGRGRWRERTFRLDDRFPSDASGRPVYAQYGDMSALGPELWVMLMEKAWAAAKGSYENIHGGMADDGLRALTGEGSDWTQVSRRDDDDILEDIHDAIVDGKPVICNTPSTLSTAALNRAAALGVTVVAGHSYNASWSNEVRRTLDIRNPHGRNHLMGLSMPDFNLFFQWYLIADDSVR